MKIRNLKKVYKTAAGNVVALSGVSFDLPDKGMVFLLGKSGSGKTTLLNVLSGMDTFDEGEIQIDGKDLSKISLKELDNYRNTCCGFVFQEYHLIPELSVRENILLSLNLKGEKNSEEKLHRVLQEVELEDYENRSVTELSGGQKQRVAIARAIIKDPEIVFADEPTGALDNKTGESILKLLKELSRERLVVVVTHDREFAEKFGDRIIEIADGKIIKDTNPDFCEQTKRSADWKSSKMPLKASLKIGCGNFKYHPIRLFITIFLCVLSFSLLGLSLTISWNSFENMALKSMRTVDLSQSSLRKYSEEGNPLPLKQSEVKEIQGKLKTPLLPVVNEEIYLPIEEEEELAPYYMVMPGGYTQISEEEIKKAGFSYEGNLPATESQVAITKFTAEILSAWKIPASVGSTLLLDEEEYTISAIVDTNFQSEPFESLKTGTDAELSSRYMSELSESVHNLIFVSDMSAHAHAEVKFFRGSIKYAQAPTFVTTKFSKIKGQTLHTLSQKEGAYAPELWLNTLLRATTCEVEYGEKTCWNYLDLLEALDGGKRDYFGTYLNYLEEYNFPKEFSGTFTDPITEYSFSLTIVGFHDEGSEEVLLPDSLFLPLFEKFGGEYDGAVAIGNGNSLKSFVSKETTFRLDNYVIQNVDRAIQILKPIRSICNVLSPVFAVFAVILFLNFIMQSLSDKTQIIGILKALGCKNAGLMKIFIWEGLIIGMIVLGIVVLILGTASIVINHIVLTELQGSYVFLFGLSAPVMLLLFAGVALFAFLGSLLPILRLSRLMPNESITSE